MRPMPRRLVVIPTYREADSLPTLLEAILSQPIELDIYVVDDDSRDGTEEILRSFREEYGDRVGYVIRRGERGFASALYTGYRYGYDTGYDYVAQMDADLQHDPQYLPRLFGKAEEGLDLVVASRYVEGGGIEGWPITRRIISWGANTYARIVLGLPIRDVTSGYRVFSREAISTLLKYRPRSRGFMIQVETAYILHRAGHRLGEVPFIFRSRYAGRSKLGIGMILEFFINVPRLRI